MAFSPDSRYLAVQYGGPDWNLALWTWEKARMAGSARTSTSPTVPIRQVQSFSQAGQCMLTGACVSSHAMLCVIYPEVQCSIS